MWARIDEEQNYKEKMFTFQTWKNNQILSNDWPTYCHTGIYHGKKKVTFRWNNDVCFVLDQRG